MGILLLLLQIADEYIFCILGHHADDILGPAGDVHSILWFACHGDDILEGTGGGEYGGGYS